MPHRVLTHVSAPAVASGDRTILHMVMAMIHLIKGKEGPRADMTNLGRAVIPPNAVSPLGACRHEVGSLNTRPWDQ